MPTKASTTKTSIAASQPATQAIDPTEFALCKVEAFCLPAHVETERSVTIEELPKEASVRVVCGNGFGLDPGLIDRLIQRATATPTSIIAERGGDYRYGVIIHTIQGEKVLEMYVTPGGDAMIDGRPCRIDKELRDLVLQLFPPAAHADEYWSVDLPRPLN